MLDANDVPSFTAPYRQPFADTWSGYWNSCGLFVGFRRCFDLYTDEEE